MRAAHPLLAFILLAALLGLAGCSDDGNSLRNPLGTASAKFNGREDVFFDGGWRHNGDDRRILIDLVVRNGERIQMELRGDTTGTYTIDGQGLIQAVFFGDPGAKISAFEGEVSLTRVDFAANELDGNFALEFPASPAGGLPLSVTEGVLDSLKTY